MDAARRFERGVVLDTFDVIVIGAGQAGSPLAARLAEAGLRTLLVERDHLGGTCVNVGCTPTKTMIASARAAHVARMAGRLGEHAESVRVDWTEVVARKDRLVEQRRSSVARRLECAGLPGPSKPMKMPASSGS